MKRIVLTALLLMLAAPAVFAAGVKGHPMVKPYSGSAVFEFKVVKFERFSVPAGKISWSNASGRDVFASTIPVEGKVTAIEYTNPEKRSVVEIQSNYAEALKQQGFEILYSCMNEECGKGRWKTKFLKRNLTLGYDDAGLLSAKLHKPDGDVYVVIGTYQHWRQTQVYVIEAKPMETGMVKVDADALLNDIERTGHASIYGIYFDTDKAQVKPTSKQALGEIAKLLKNRPDLKIYVVGHTDNVGALDYNMDLSRRRARAVVNVLVNDYGIAAARLHAAGVGPLAPVLANTSDTGRAKNRRVELVAR